MSVEHDRVADVAEGWTEAGIYASADAGFDHGLVVLAMGLPYWLRAKPTGFSLLVPLDSAGAVRGQLELFDRENIARPTERPLTNADRGSGFAIAAIWAWGITLMFFAQDRWPALTEAGAMDARALFSDGDWWRPFTAQLLHADAGHLIGNLAAGVFLLWGVMSGFGRACGVVLATTAAAMGSLAVATVYFPGEYKSIGASTTVFAALGLLTGSAVLGAMGSVGRQARRSSLTALGAGVAMLMLFGGAGDARVDVPAHAACFFAGLFAGGMATAARSWRRG